MAGRKGKGQDASPSPSPSLRWLPSPGGRRSQAAIVIQARMGSSRYPGKVLAPLGHRPMLQVLLERLRPVALRENTPLIVATSDNADDAAIAQMASAVGAWVFRGAHEDVLRRYTDAARAFCLDAVVRVCADAPLTCPTGILTLLTRWHGGGGSREGFYHTRHARGWPPGTAADLIGTDLLVAANAVATKPSEREHVVPWFKTGASSVVENAVCSPPSLLRPDLFLAVDTPAQLASVDRLCCDMGVDPVTVDVADVVAWLDARPHCAETLIHAASFPG